MSGGGGILWDESARVRDAIGLLPVRQRESLFLVYYAQLTHAEAGAVLGISASTVSSNVSIARRELARQLKPGAVDA